MIFTSEKSRSDRPDFIFVGDHAAIDFANTLASPRGYLEELLPTWPDLVAWLSQAGLVKDTDLTMPGIRAAESLKKVVEFRQAWKAELAHLVDGGKVRDGFLDQLNLHLVSDTFHETVHRDGKRGLRLHRSSSRLSGEKFTLALVARQIALFLSEANLSYLHRCANTATCVLYFYDTTKNHRRQWCSVAACGNRHKVAAFRKRQATSQN